MNKELKQNKTFIALLRRKGYNQKKLAEAVGVIPATLNGWLWNRYKPTAGNLVKMSVILDVDIDELNNIFFGGE